MPVWFRNYLPFGLLLGVFVLFQWLRNRQRGRALSTVANQLGLAFEATDWGSRNSGPQLESPHFGTITARYAQNFRNSLSGERQGFRVSFFDHVVSGRGGGHTDTIASFTQKIYLPTFSLAQEDLLSKIGDAIVHRTIEFTSDPTFSERFRLIGTDEDRIRELFTADMLEFLESIEPEWQIEASGHSLLIYRYGRTVKPSDFPDFVDETTELAKTFFSHCRLKQPAF